MKTWILALALGGGCLKMDPELDDTSPTPTDEDLDGDGVLSTEDCDDNNPAVHPGADELCDDLDNDCDGVTDEDPTDAATWYADTDADSFGDPDAPLAACSRPAGYVADSTDCDDDDEGIFPDAEELCDGLDNNCDGETDEGTGATSTFYADTDGDGYGDPEAPTEACVAPPDHVEDNTDCDDSDAGTHPDADELCDGADNNCDGSTDEDPIDPATWYADDDGDGHGDPTRPSAACEPPAGHVATDDDCDDTDAAVSPDAVELCNTRDDDCDGTTDEPDAADAPTWYTDSDGDTYGDPATGAPACEAPSGAVSAAGDCDDTQAQVSPAATERCDGLDNNCDGSTDGPDAEDAATWYADADADSYGDPGSSTPACTQPSGYVADNTDCDDSDSASYPGASEVQDAWDNDCDGMCDEDTTQAGDLLITEILLDPKAVVDTAGEWFEVYNPNTYDVRICDGWTIEDTGGSSHTVTSEVLVPAGERVVFGLQSDTSLNGGVTLDYQYSGVQLNNAGEGLMLAFDGGLIDEVDLGAAWGELLTAGYSVQLDPDVTGASENDDASNWCKGTTTFGKGDVGTPGDANDQCF